MFPRQLLRKLLPLKRPIHHPNAIRFSSSSSEAQTRSRIDRVLNRFPRFLHPYTNGLRDAPVTHVVSFLILHEVTAVVPLIGLSGLFHWTGWVPDVLAEGSYVSEGVQKFGRYFARKGWFGFHRPQTEALETGSNDEEEGMTAERRVQDVRKSGWGVGESGSRILVEVATAYAITKVFLPCRVVLSVWATPWFAKNVLGRMRGISGGRRVVKEVGAAGTGARAAGVVGKGVEKGNTP